MEGVLATLPRLQFSGLVQEAARFIESFAAQTRAIEELAAQTRATDEAFAAQQSPLTTIATQMARTVEPFCTPPPWPLTASPQQIPGSARTTRDNARSRVAAPADRRGTGRTDHRDTRAACAQTPPGNSRALTGVGLRGSRLAVLSAILRGKTAKPTTEAEVKRLLRDWLQERYADEPADSKLREHAKLLLTYIRD